MMALEILRCEIEEKHEPHVWRMHPQTAMVRRVQCLGEKVEPIDVRISPEFTLADVRVSPEFELANWFVCQWRGHRWRWLVRYRWGRMGIHAFVPVAERCSRCGIRRNPDPFRWLAQLSEWSRSCLC